MIKWPNLFKKKEKKETDLFKESNVKKREIASLKSNQLAKSALSLLSSLIDEIGPRPAGSEATRKTAHRLSEEFKKYSDDTIITTHRATPARYFGIFKELIVASALMVILCFVGQPLFALVVLALFGYCVYHGFLKCDRIKGPNFFPKKDLTNVHSVIEPEEEVTSTVILSAHHDSAPLYKCTEKDKRNYFFTLYLPLISFALTSLIAVAILLIEVFSLKLLRFNLPSLPSLILLIVALVLQFSYYKLWGYVTDTYSPGAGDNLVSSTMLVELSHYFSWKKANGKGLKNTRLIFASFDGEEVGLIGSRAWYDQYKGILVNPININIDAPFTQEALTFLTKDANGFVSLDKSLASALCEQAEKMGYDALLGELPLFAGATDAASAARVNIPSTTLMGIKLSKDGVEPYHTLNDTPDALDSKMVETVISILIRYIENNYKEEKRAEEKISLLLDTDKTLPILR